MMMIKAPLLARIYFPQTGVFELHDNSYIRYQTLNDEVESKTGNLSASTCVRDPEDYKYLIGTRHVDPDSGCTYIKRPNLRLRQIRTL